MNIKTISLTVCLLVIAGFCLRACWMGPEAQVRKQLSELESLVSYEAGEGELSSLGKVKRLGALFTEDVSIEFRGFQGARDVHGRKSIQQVAMAARSQAASLEASLHDLNIMISEEGRSATVEATGRAKVGGDNRSMVQNFVFILKKTSEGWLIEEARTVKALR